MGDQVKVCVPRMAAQSFNVNRDVYRVKITIAFVVRVAFVCVLLYCIVVYLLVLHLVE
jgi:hypothetical protein